MKLLGLLSVFLLTLSSFADAPAGGFFVGNVSQVLQPGTAIFSGNLWVPATPAQKKELQTDQVAADLHGEVVIEGVPEDLVDRAPWNGHVVFQGVRQFTTVLGAKRTMHAFRVAAAPPAAKPKPGAWIYEK